MAALQVNSQNVKYTDNSIEVDYTYSTSKVLNRNGNVIVSSSKQFNYDQAWWVFHVWNIQCGENSSRSGKIDIKSYDSGNEEKKYKKETIRAETL